ncbi:undecaprenyl-phosphate glucose phosphotransferase [Sandaracinobacter sp. RS1-74]|uniref:undecaprenyl-phosphate glucose phosphotransferase n=1 Tax=Sandaracinobacteroides sayramensis TaxID=2913411 RepID=UPI001EDB6F12|nr:undecaprenyl-phosphate glucose phosphotransferase [Sandaracinobacteroides sayramensis]MCG2840230.1 undecaprenyl-phosphate glucose phosphotransferase [Sandaracinobacteroides sayramensis]
MNSRNPVAQSPSPAPSRTSVPIDLVVFAVRAVEFLTVILAGIVALYFWAHRIEESSIRVYGQSMLLGALIFALVAEIMGAYDVDCHFSVRKAWQRVMGSWVVTALFLVTIGFLMKVSEDYSRGWATTWFITSAVMLAGTRAAMTMWIRRLKGQGVFNSRVAIYGASAQGQKLAQYVRGNSKLTISLVGFFDDRRDGRVPVIVDDLPVFGTSDDLVAMIRDGLIDQVIVALPWSAEERIRQVVQKLVLTPVRIRLAPDLANFAFAHRPLVLLGDMPVITLFERPISGTDAIVKRAEDLLLTSLIMLFIWPVMLLTALAVKLDSPGPIFFRQPREGFNNQRFDVLKFRSMTHDLCQTDGVKQATRGDKRVTRVGRIIRATSMDELPQLFNVLKGDMSLVGPRPHAPSTRANGRLFHEVVQTYAARHKVKPGITGWAQVCGWRGETDTEEKLVKRLEHDLYYIENWSVSFDIYILFRTVFAVIFPKNAF